MAQYLPVLTVDHRLCNVTELSEAWHCFRECRSLKVCLDLREDFLSCYLVKTGGGLNNFFPFPSILQSPSKCWRYAYGLLLTGNELSKRQQGNIVEATLVTYIHTYNTYIMYNTAGIEPASPVIGYERERCQPSKRTGNANLTEKMRMLQLDN